MSVVAGFHATTARSSARPVARSGAVPAQRPEPMPADPAPVDAAPPADVEVTPTPMARRWTPTPAVVPFVAKRPAALVPVTWLAGLSLLVGFFQPFALIATLLLVAGAGALRLRWSRARRRAEQRNAELRNRPGRHARPVGVDRNAVLGHPDAAG